MRPSEVRTLSEMEVHQPEIRRIDADDFARPMPSLTRDDAVDDNLAARRVDIGDDFTDAGGVEIREPGGEALGFLLVVLVDLPFLLLHDGRDDDVVGAEESHLLEN